MITASEARDRADLIKEIGAEEDKEFRDKYLTFIEISINTASGTGGYAVDYIFPNGQRPTAKQLKLIMDSLTEQGFKVQPNVDRCLGGTGRIKITWEYPKSA